MSIDLRTGGNAPNYNIGSPNGYDRGSSIFNRGTTDRVDRSTAQTGSPDGIGRNQPYLPPPQSAGNANNSAQYAPRTYDNQSGLPADTNQQTTLTNTFSTELTSYVSQNNLTPEDAQQIQFAFYNPPPAANVTLSNGQSLQDACATVIANTATQLLAQGDNATNLTPNNVAYDRNLSDAYNGAFENAVNSDSSLTPEQKKAIIYLHYNPSAVASAPQDQQEALNKYQQVALTDLQQNYGTPEGWTPKLNSANYTSNINRTFNVNLKVALNSYASENNFSSADLALLKKAIENPNDSSIPPAIRAAANKIIKTATVATRSVTGIPDSHNLTVNRTSLSSVDNNTTATGFSNAKEVVAKTTTAVNLFLPNSPSKDATLSMLAKISAGIAALQESIQSMQVANTNAAKNNSLAQVDIQNDQSAKLKDQHLANLKAQAKQQKLGILATIFKPIMAIIEAIVGMASLGVLAVPFAALDAKFDLLSNAVKGIADAVTDLVNKMIPDQSSPAMAKLADALSAGIQIGIFVGMMTNPSTMGIIASMGPNIQMTIMEDMLTNSTIVQNLAQMCGASDDTAQYIAMGVGMAVTLAVGIASSINPENLPEAVTQTAAQVTESALNTVEKVIEAIKPALDAIQSLSKIKDVEKIAEEVGDVEKAISSITQSIDKVGQSVGEGVQSLMNGVFSKIADAIRDNKILKNVIEELSEAVKSSSLEQGTGIFRAINEVQFGTQVVNGVSQILTGISSFNQAQLARQKGQTDADIAQLQAIVKLLQKVINSILSALSSLGDDAAALQDLHSKIVNDLSNTATATSQIA